MHISKNFKIMLVLVGLFLVVIAIVDIFSFIFANDLLKERVENQFLSEESNRGDDIRLLLNIYKQQISDLNHYIFSDGQITNIIKENELNKGNNISLNNTNQSRILNQKISSYNLILDTYMDIYNVQIIDKYGVILLSTNPLSIGKKISNNELLKYNNFNAKNNLSSIINFDTLNSNNKNGQLVSFTSPIKFDNKDNLTIVPFNKNQNQNNKFYISIQIYTDSFNHILLDRKGLGQTGEVYLVNSNKMMVSPSRFINNSHKVLVDTLPVKQCFDAETSKNIGDTYNDYRNIPIIGFSYCAKDLGFVLLSEIDKSEVLQPITELSNAMIKTSVLSGLILILISIVTIILIMSWNKKLKNAVDKSTSDLKKTLDMLYSTNEKLKIHDKLKDEFLNIASHELRTPTQAITGYCELIKYYPEKAFVYLKVIERNAQILYNLVNDILDVTKIETSNLKLHKVIFNIEELISEVIKDIIEQFKDIENTIKDMEYKNNRSDNIAKDDNIFNFSTSTSKINIQLTSSDFSRYEPILVKADKDRIKQVISNILTNSIKFAKDKYGQITISIEKGINSDHTEDNGNNNGHMIIIKIIDKGIGIDKNILPRLFEKFATKSERGTGLGLYICKKIIEAHGGKIWAYNNNDRTGATFCFSLPLTN